MARWTGEMMRLRRKEKEYSLGEELGRALRGKSIPLLVLDEKWLELFPEHMQSPLMGRLVSEMNELLKQQGKQADEIKGMKRYKSQLMQEIVENMDADDSLLGKLKRKKMEKNQQKILDLKEEMEQREGELAKLPHQLRQVNMELLAESARLCYERFQVNQERVDELEEEIADLKRELRRKTLDMQDREMKNERMYTYLHSMLGAGAMERFDAMLKKEKL